MIKAIMFDFGLTLVNSVDGFRQAEVEAATRIFDDLGFDAWSDFLSDDRVLRQKFLTSLYISRKALWEAVYLHYNQEPDRGFLLMSERGNWETINTMTRPFPESQVVLEQLASEYRLTLITNTQGQVTPGSHRISLFPSLACLFEVMS